MAIAVKGCLHFSGHTEKWGSMLINEWVGGFDPSANYAFVKLGFFYKNAPILACHKVLIKTVVLNL